MLIKLLDKYAKVVDQYEVDSMDLINKLQISYENDAIKRTFEQDNNDHHPHLYLEVKV